MHANQREEIKEVRAGDIAAAVGLKDVVTGDTLCDPHKIITLERMDFPEPVIHVAVEPKTKMDQEKMGIALNRLAQEDPSFRVRTDEESGQRIISGMGELHLESIVERMKRQVCVAADAGVPQGDSTERIGNKIDVGGVLAYARFGLVIGDTRELNGFPDFSADDVLTRLDQFLLGGYPTLTQCLVLRKPAAAPAA